jgi:hypothetical protein
MSYTFKDVLLRRHRCFLGFFAILLCINCVVATQAHGATVLTHQGDTDPTAEGFAGMWVFGSPATFGPIADDLGKPAWSVTGLGQSSQYAYAAGPLTPSQTADLTSKGFTFTIVARAIQGIAPTYDALNPVGIAGGGVHTGVQRFDIGLGLDSNGDTVVVLPTSSDATGPGNSLVGFGLAYTLAGNDYHTYSLIFDPVSQLADLYVDGVSRIQGYSGNTSFVGDVPGFYFGESSGGQANFNYVSLSIVPEPSTCLLLGIGLFIVVGRRFWRG